MTDRAIETEAICRIGLDAGLSAVGVTSTAVLEPARSVLFRRREAGFASTMAFTYRNPERSTEPVRILDGAASIVVGLLGYATADRGDSGRAAGSGPPAGRIARYTWTDRYAELRAALATIGTELGRSGFQSRVVADENALVDRNVAWRAGLGWYGKNTNLLVEGAGSWFVIGSVVTDAPLVETGPPAPDGCGPCSVCIDECPTGALVAPGVLDARRCIAWFVQAGEPIPAEYREAVGDWLYGCDICQDVCPPNRVTIGRSRDTASGSQALDIEWVLTASDEDLLETCGRWYIADRDPDVIRRTALVVLGNIGDRDRPATRDLLRRYGRNPNPLLRAHTVWAARRLGLTDTVAATEHDPSPAVRAEWTAAVRVR